MLGPWGGDLYVIPLYTESLDRVDSDITQVIGCVGLDCQQIGIIQLRPPAKLTTV